MPRKKHGPQEYEVEKKGAGSWSKGKCRSCQEEIHAVEVGGFRVLNEYCRRCLPEMDQAILDSKKRFPKGMKITGKSQGNRKWSRRGEDPYTKEVHSSGLPMGTLRRRYSG